MEKKTTVTFKSNRIEKTTSRIAFIGLAAATMAMTVSIIGATRLQEASAAKPIAFCYNSAAGEICTETMQDCQNTYRQFPQFIPTSRCRPVK
jgi:hypothetical protein